MSLDISVVIPLLNEEESLPELTSWIDKVMTENSFTYEIIFINDGSTDRSWAVINDLSTRFKEVRGISFKRNYGKSAALQVGFSQASGNVIITMDADLQDSPEEIPELYNLIFNHHFDLISGWKKKRFDPLTKTIPTKLFNWATRKVSGLKLHDFNCGLKAYKRKAIQSVEVYGEMHRYIPFIVSNAGFTKIGEKVVQHQPRKYGETKFGVSRFVNGFLDLMTIYFIGKFGKRPMHFFGLIGTLFVILGFAILGFLSIDKLFFNIGGMTDRPLFFFGILSFIVGTQIFATGFIAELISRNSPNRNHYLIDEKLNIEGNFTGNSIVTPI